MLCHVYDRWVEGYSEDTRSTRILRNSFTATAIYASAAVKIFKLKFQGTYLASCTVAKGPVPETQVSSHQGEDPSSD